MPAETQLRTSQILDLLSSAYEDFKPKQITSIAANLQEYEVMPRLMKKEVTTYSGPHGASWKVYTGLNEVYRREALHPRRDYAGADKMTDANAPWVYANTYSSYERREFKMNMGKKRIFNLIEVGEYNALLSAAEGLENDFWNIPASTSDDLKPYGVFYWLTYSASSGFNGGNHSNFSSGKGGISSTTYTNWKNRTEQYSAITSGDACLKIRNCLSDCKWKAPVNKAQFRGSSGDRRRLYGAASTVRSFENAAMAQNDRLGGDLGAMDGITTIRKVPFVEARQLDSLTTSAPILGINWDDFGFAVPEGGSTYRHDPRFLSDQPNTCVTDIDFQYQIVAFNLRTHFLIAKSDPTSEL
jgi:hypothetical protein